MVRWPSVYAWGWFMGVPGTLLIFVASLFIAAWELEAAASVWRVDSRHFGFFFAPTLLILGLLAYKVVDCPRCGRSAFRHGRWSWGNIWPRRRCSRCDLDLAQVHPFDRRAGSESF